MRRTFVTAALLAVVATSCGWAQTDFDSGRTRTNPFENHITAAIVGSLQLHAVPLPPPSSGDSPPTLRAVVGNQIITQQGANVVAYDATTCPCTDSGVCTPLWTRTSTRFWGSDGSRFVFTVAPLTTGTLTVEVTDTACNHLWNGNVTPLPSVGSNIDAIAFRNKIIASVLGGYGPMQSRSACSHPQGAARRRAIRCTPSRTARWSANRWVASGDTIVLNVAPNEQPGLHAFDMTTGIERGVRR